MILYGDARDVLANMETGSVQALFTSPPYYEQRTYGRDDREIGHGTLDTYLGDLGVVLDHAHRIVDSEGWMGWVIGDKSAGSGGAGGDHNKTGSKNWIEKYGKVPRIKGIRDGSWIMVPYRFADMAMRRGWLLRSVVVWDKSPMVKPEDPKHINRPMISTERILLFTKTVRARRWRHEMLENVDKADIWHVRTHRGAQAERHYAPFPGELPRRFILATTEQGMTVLDPFAGSGTTVKVAKGLHRIGVGVELYEPKDLT